VVDLRDRSFRKTSHDKNRLMERLNYLQLAEIYGLVQKDWSLIYAKGQFSSILNVIEFGNFKG